MPNESVFGSCSPFYNVREFFSGSAIYEIYVCFVCLHWLIVLVYFVGSTWFEDHNYKIGYTTGSTPWLICLYQGGFTDNAHDEKTTIAGYNFIINMCSFLMLSSSSDIVILTRKVTVEVKNLVLLSYLVLVLIKCYCSSIFFGGTTSDHCLICCLKWIWNLIGIQLYLEVHQKISDVSKQ